MYFNGENKLKKQGNKQTKNKLQLKQMKLLGLGLMRGGKSSLSVPFFSFCFLILDTSFSLGIRQVKYVCGVKKIIRISTFMMIRASPSISDTNTISTQALDH